MWLRFRALDISNNSVSLPTADSFIVNYIFLKLVKDLTLLAKISTHN